MTILQVLYLDSLEVDVPVKKCAVRVEAWTGRAISRVIQQDLKDDGDYGKLRVRSCFRRLDAFSFVLLL